MNEIAAIAVVFTNYISFKYLINDIQFNIEVPITDKNKYIVTGDKVTLALGILK